MNSEEWTSEYSEQLIAILRKLKKKDPVKYNIILKKRDDIKEKIKINPGHFKNLQHGLSEFRRVHIDRNFVLIFKVDKRNRTLRFEDFDHHDNIY